MSHLAHQSKQENDFEIWLEEQGFERISDDFYGCPGMHIWHIDDVLNLYKEESNKPAD